MLRTSQSGATREDGEESKTWQGTESQKLAQKNRMLQHSSSRALTSQGFSGDHYFLLDTNNVGIILEGVAASSLVLRAKG